MCSVQRVVGRDPNNEMHWRRITSWEFLRSTLNEALEFLQRKNYSSQSVGNALQGLNLVVWLLTALARQGKPAPSRGIQPHCYSTQRFRKPQSVRSFVRSREEPSNVRTSWRMRFVGFNVWPFVRARRWRIPRHQWTACWPPSICVWACVSGWTQRERV
jgi:hypothetical protein